ncbi:MAG TPA: type VI secretion system ATPase TssH [Gemmatimonadales bacterium]|nr:type VI secretion system ATPase TssH [Gemmatimonadales bacterium]
MNVNLKSLVGKLNPETRSALESAAGLCLSRTNYDVEIEHYLLKILDRMDGDAASILKHFGVDRSRLAADLTRSLDKLKTGNARNPTISPSLVKMFSEAWLLASVDLGDTQVRTGHTLLALVGNEELARMAGEMSKEFAKVQPEALRKDFQAATASSTEMTSAPSAEAGSGEPGAGKKPGGKTPNLDAYTVDLTQRAKDGKIDPVLGRDFEVRQVVDVLTRRRQNNPILVGEAGVGKTAVVEGFAHRIVTGDVPPPLRNVVLKSLDLALLQAGAGVKGEFENRLKGLIEEVKNSVIPIILFIDEAHTMIGAGGAAGQNDAANLLKPALARGELRTIAATTWSEYKKYFEKDPALARRFQLIKVEEPSEETCKLMLRAGVGALEKHHSVRILDDGLEAAVKLSHRYIPDRQLPDKAVSVLDTACARLALGQNTTPPAIEDAMRLLDDLAIQARVLEREATVGADHSERLESIAKQRAKTEETLKALKERWEKERGIVEKIRAAREHLEQTLTSSGPGRQSKVGRNPLELKDELQQLEKELEQLQGDQPLVRVCVDGSLVGEVISAWTGIPTGKMVTDEMATALNLEQLLAKRVIGQDHAMQYISKRIRTSKVGITDPEKPIGVFLLVGPSGVGKTETALALADLLYGGEHNLITINMSEFQEAHTVSTLKGSPPGYVGYGEGGVLTEAVRRKPYSVVLLDEIEKAHPDVLELFFQVFDKGRMDDGEGRSIDFKNCIIVLTTNCGTDTLMKLCADPETMPDDQGLAKALKPEMDKTFKPAFLGRTVIIPYFPIRDQNLKSIIQLKLRKIQKRLYQVHRIELVAQPEMIEEVARRCTEVESGARNVDNILSNTLLPEVSTMLLGAMVGGTKPTTIKVTVGDGGAFVYQPEGSQPVGARAG